MTFLYCHLFFMTPSSARQREADGITRTNCASLCYYSLELTLSSAFQPTNHLSKAKQSKATTNSPLYRRKKQRRKGTLEQHLKGKATSKQASKQQASNKQHDDELSSHLAMPPFDLLLDCFIGICIRGTE